ncbi:DUF4190 domain-containing protein, partial [Streptomyces sp. T-3]|nr:DUF4190 domain-containing protein [Streptomyces sp. T-3]
PAAQQGPGAPTDAVPPPPIGPEGPAQPAYGGQPPYGGQPGHPGHPGYPGYPSYPGGGPGYGWGYGQGPMPSNGMGTAAMVLGILSIVLFCFWGILSIILGILALIFGIMGRKKAGRGEATNGGMALAGIITGAIGIVVGIAMLSFMIWAIVESEKNSDRYDDPSYDTAISAPR